MDKAKNVYGIMIVDETNDISAHLDRITDGMIAAEETKFSNYEQPTGEKREVVIKTTFDGLRKLKDALNR